MTFSIPDWFVFAILALAAFRTYRLIGRDTILDRPRKWSVDLPRDWKEGDPIPDGYRENLAMFWECAWCSGAWNALAWWLLWVVSHRWAAIVAVPWALSALVALIEKNAD